MVKCVWCGATVWNPPPPTGRRCQNRKNVLMKFCEQNEEPTVPVEKILCQNLMMVLVRFSV